MRTETCLRIIFQRSRSWNYTIPRPGHHANVCWSDEALKVVQLSTRIIKVLVCNGHKFKKRCLLQNYRVGFIRKYGLGEFPVPWQLSTPKNSNKAGFKFEQTFPVDMVVQRVSADPIYMKSQQSCASRDAVIHEQCSSFECLTRP